ncbi:peptidoglycan-binding domain-containing protein [uncultured Roseibium sp.]|uniref:peptidoglycan-binding domain-containing protein n=1 Tax=uncultured Roseibium sp. TaxID=1936171 RepID=UPI0026394419|nr:peptidoglycan-binding domain-containing protein [uncultured Roseibium sp.]
MRLTSPRFNWNMRLQQTADNNPPMKHGDNGLYVRHVQQALIDLSHPLPKSTAKHGSPDGDFGNETKNAVIEFQRKQRATDPDFDVDGIVGEQTMGVFDRLLRTPVTLARIPTSGDLTDSDSNLAQAIINVLEHPRLAEVNFIVQGTHINKTSFDEVRDAMKRGEVTAEQHALPANVSAVYFARDALNRVTGEVLVGANTFVMSSSRINTDSDRAVVVHEATHAFCDIRAFGSDPAGAPFSRDKSETIAHVAQGTFHHILTGGPQVDPLTSDPTLGLNPIFLKADEVARQLLGTRAIQTLTLNELATLVRANRTALGQNNNTNFDGVI